MKNKANLKTNLIFNTITQLIIYLTPLIVSPYISRVLLPEGIGQFSHASSYAFYFSAAISLGYASAGINKIAINRNDSQEYSKCFWAIMLEKLLLSILSISLYFIILCTTKFDGKVDFNVGYSLVIVLINACLDIKFLFQGLEKFRIISIITMISNFLYMVCIFLFVKNTNDVLIYTIFKSSIDLIINLFLWILAIKLVNRPTIDFNICWQVFKTSLIFFLPSLLMSIGTQLDQTIIGALCSDAEAGYYTQASKFPTLISNMTYSIAPVMLSRISFLYQEKKLDEVKNKMSKAFTLAFFISVPCCVGLYAIGSNFIPLYFGDEFSQSIPILYILLINTLFSPLSSILINSYFYPTKQTRKLTLFLFFSLVGNILMTVLGIAVFNLGGRGAALGTLMAECLLFGCLLACACNALDFKLILKDLWKILLAAATIFASIYLINFVLDFNEWVNLIIDISIGIMAYLVVTLITKETFIMQIFNSFVFRIKSSKNNDAKE